jgi:hypothetical protein
LSEEEKSEEGKPQSASEMKGKISLKSIEELFRYGLSSSEPPHGLILRLRDVPCNR